MALFEKKVKNLRYHATTALEYASVEELEKWAPDPNCIEQQECTRFLDDRLAKLEVARLERDRRLTKKRARLEEDPFDARNEISADAKHIAQRIVSTLWFIFVLLPIVLGVLFAIIHAIAK
jgi:hypothetical protein